MATEAEPMMRIDPCTDSLAFVMGNTADHDNLGSAKYILVALFVLLLVAGVAFAVINFAREPAQRTPRNLGIWLIRTFMGIMWFQGSLWKLPLPISGGLQYWTGEMAKYSTFAWHERLVRDVILPNLALLNPLVYLTELGLAASLILGLATRLGAWVAILFTLNLWVGLYRDPAEWPWTYIFIIFVHGFIALDRGGRSLGLDATLARRRLGATILGRAWRLAS